MRVDEGVGCRCQDVVGKKLKVTLSVVSGAQAHQTPRAVDGQRMRHSSIHRRLASRLYHHTHRRHAELYRCANEREAAGARKGPEHPLPCMNKSSIALKPPPLTSLAAH